MNINIREFPEDLHKKLKLAALKADMPFHAYLILLLAQASDEAKKGKK